MSGTAPNPSAAREAGPGASRWRAVATAALLAAGVAVPIYAALTGDTYLVALASRILVYALAAVGLNLALGFGGMVSFGHAMYLGLGAYAVLLLGTSGITNGWLQLAILVIVVGVVAAVVGTISLRARGIAFIMITLAFAQLFYFLFVSLKAWGGDEGMSLPQPSSFGPFTGNRTALYFALLATLAAALAGTHRLVGSRFGLVLRATRVNERRVRALGTAPLPYRLAAYVLSALLCALAGFFLANLTGFVSPAYLAWTVSGELIVMVVLGGAGTVVGPVAGAVGLLVLEEGLKALTEHWMAILGPLIVLMVVLLRNGLWSLLPGGVTNEARR